MPGRPTVSVAICLLNSSRFIDETLQSVFAQTFDDYEVVLVDDGSTDGCAEAIERRYRDRRLTITRQEGPYRLSPRVGHRAGSTNLPHISLAVPPHHILEVCEGRDREAVSL